MSLFNKGLFSRFRPNTALFSKAAGVGRSLFNKAPAALRSFSSGLGRASQILGQAASGADKAISNPEVKALARQVGAGGALGSLSGLTGAAGSASALLGRASQATNPATYRGQSPAGAASSAIERAKSLGGEAKQLFM